MKKQYTNPKMKVVNVRPSSIICGSPLSFGNGTTDTMYGKQRNGFSDDEEAEGGLWNE